MMNNVGARYCVLAMKLQLALQVFRPMCRRMEREATGGGGSGDYLYQLWEGEGRQQKREFWLWDFWLLLLKGLHLLIRD